MKKTPAARTSKTKSPKQKSSRRPRVTSRKRAELKATPQSQTASPASQPRPIEDLAEADVKKAIARLGDAPPPTNLDRALPPAARARERAARHPASAHTPAPAATAHFIVVLDRARVRIFSSSQPRGQLQPSLEQVHAVDFPHGRQNYFDRDTDQQGQFPSGSATGVNVGSIDERLPTELEQERRLAATIAETLRIFFNDHPTATWNLAAEARLQREILERLAPSLRGRLRHTAAKDISKQPAHAILAHFSSNGSVSH